MLSEGNSRILDGERQFLWPFVTNDNLFNLLGAIFVYVALRYVFAPNRGRLAVVGVVYVLLLLTNSRSRPFFSS